MILSKHSHLIKNLYLNPIQQKGSCISRNNHNKKFKKLDEKKVPTPIYLQPANLYLSRT